MESLLGPLLPLYQRERAAGRAVALGLLIDTRGSTYRKPGALMLIAANGEFAGLLSGGCLEGDLREHAQAVIESGQARVASYDMRGGDDLIWGLGLGCEGAMHILLLRVGPHSSWQPLQHLAYCFDEYRPTAIGIVIESDLPGAPLGSIVLPESEMPRPLRAALEAAARNGIAGWFEENAPRHRVFVLPLNLPPKLLLLGAGPDAAPVVEFAVRMNWRVTVVDHRPAYADPTHFPTAQQVVLARPDELLNSLDPNQFDAAVVMSHHLLSDLSYLRALADTDIAYIGLLGPAVRRERLLADLGDRAEDLRYRLRSPVGLPIGGRAPESIALAVIAEIHAFVHGADVRELPAKRAMSA